MASSSPFSTLLLPVSCRPQPQEPISLLPAAVVHSPSAASLRSRSAFGVSNWTRSRLPAIAAVSSSSSASEGSSSLLHALIFDCDGVILESEHLHRQAYNDAFAHFNVRCPSSPSQPIYWDSDFYDELQNRIGGGKPKMRWYFGEKGWPSSSISVEPPTRDDDRALLVDTLQDWKTERYKEIIKSGTVKTRPGVIRLMDDAKASGIKLADRFEQLNCFLAGDDVKEKKPDPSIYKTAAKKLGVLPENCLVVEDSVIGLLAATGAEMRCVVTYTSSTANQDFKDAIAIYPDLSNVRLEDLELLLQNSLVAR